jgi:hypothetical protein
MWSLNKEDDAVRIQMPLVKVIFGGQTAPHALPERHEGRSLVGNALELTWCYKKKNTMVKRPKKPLQENLFDFVSKGNKLFTLIWKNKKYQNYLE